MSLILPFLRGATMFALSATLVSAATASEFPKRKSGLWEIRSSSPQAAPAGPAVNTMQMCIDEKTDNAVQQQMAGVKANCSRQDVSRSGNRTVVDSVCRFGETTARTHAVFTGSFDSSYKVDTRSSYEPAMMGVKESSVTIEARWVGPCKPDQRPGDMILGNGMKINMNDAKGAPRGK